LGPSQSSPVCTSASLGLDTNVFYTPTDRRSDFTAGGSPGLEVILPIRSSVLLTLGGGVDYLYFLRTESPRRLTGDGRVRLERIGPRAAAGFEASYRRSFSRPNFEVDRRVAQDQKQAWVEGRVGIGHRLELRTEATATRTEVDGHQEFFGADLRRTLSRDTYLGRLTTDYRLTARGNRVPS
jgi:hypothetical protein